MTGRRSDRDIALYRKVKPIYLNQTQAQPGNGKVDERDDSDMDGKFAFGVGSW
jgi:hypothetical protein